MIWEAQVLILSKPNFINPISAIAKITGHLWELLHVEDKLLDFQTWITGWDSLLYLTPSPTKLKWMDCWGGLTLTL